MAQELTFNITEDVRRLKRPTTVKDFKLSFGHADQGPTDVVIGDDGNIVQGRYGDSARQVFVNVVQGENNEPVDITGYLPEFNGCIPDAEHIVIDNWDGVLVDPRHGRFRFDFPIQAFTVAGSYKQAYFRLVQNGTGKTLATLEFDMQVLEDFVYSNIVPQDYVTPYLDMINKLKDAYTNFIGKTQDSFDQAKKRLDDIMSTVEDKADTVEQRLKIDEQALAELSKKIDDKGVFTKEEADAFKQSLSDQLTNSVNQKVEAAIAEIKSYGLATTNIRKQIVYNGYWSNLDLSHSGGVYTSSIDAIKNELDQMAPLVDGVTLLFHQYITGGKLVVLENLDTFKQAIDYAKSKGLIIAGYKFHCTTSIEDIKSYGVSEFFADYKANVDKVTSALPEAGVPLILFNERGDLYNVSSPYSGNVHNVLQDLVSASYKVDISFQSLQDFINADPHVQEIVDSILINSYAMISDKNRETTLPDIVTGIDANFYNSALYVHSLYPQKPLIMSEFGIKNNWAAFDETWSWNFSSVYDDPTGKVYYLYLRGLMQSETIKLFDGVWLWFYADLLQSDAGKEYLRAYKKGVI